VSPPLPIEYNWCVPDTLPPPPPPPPPPADGHREGAGAEPSPGPASCHSPACALVRVCVRACACVCVLCSCFAFDLGRAHVPVALVSPLSISRACSVLLRPPSVLQARLYGSTLSLLSLSRCLSLSLSPSLPLSHSQPACLPPYLARLSSPTSTHSLSSVTRMTPPFPRPAGHLPLKRLAPSLRRRRLGLAMSLAYVPRLAPARPLLHLFACEPVQYSSPSLWRRDTRRAAAACRKRKLPRSGAFTSPFPSHAAQSRQDLSLDPGRISGDVGRSCDSDKAWITGPFISPRSSPAATSLPGVPIGDNTGTNTRPCASSCPPHRRA
jgi:hypothetical protein